MDPNACLEEMLSLQEARDELGRLNGAEQARFAELFEALHVWLTGGGFLPGAWNRGARGARGA